MASPPGTAASSSKAAAAAGGEARTPVNPALARMQQGRQVQRADTFQTTGKPDFPLLFTPQATFAAATCVLWSRPLMLLLLWFTCLHRMAANCYLFSSTSSRRFVRRCGHDAAAPLPAHPCLPGPPGSVHGVLR